MGAKDSRAPARFHDQHTVPAQVTEGVGVGTVAPSRVCDALGAEGVDQQHVVARLRLAQQAHAVGVEDRARRPAGTLG